jgi:hypothetical protein
MADVRDAVVDEVTQRGRNLLLTELLRLIERQHPEESPGVTRGTLEAYADTLAGEPRIKFEANELMEEIDAARIDAETWVGDDVLYDLGENGENGEDRLSAYPRGWHDRLGGETDVREYVEYLESDESGFTDDSPRGGRGEGIDQPTLLEVVSVLGDVDQGTVRAQIEERRAEGQLEQPADQHPDARVQLDRSSS